MKRQETRIFARITPKEKARISSSRKSLESRCLRRRPFAWAAFCFGGLLTYLLREEAVQVECRSRRRRDACRQAVSGGAGPFFLFQRAVGSLCLAHGLPNGEPFRHIHSKRDGRFARGPPDGKSAMRTVLQLRPPFASQAALPDGRRWGIRTAPPFADRFRAGL